MSDVQEMVNGFLIETAKVEAGRAAKEGKIEVKPEMVSPVQYSPDGLTIILPEGMNCIQGAFNLIKRFAEEETYRNYNRNYKNFLINDFMATMGVLIPRYFGMLHVSRVDTAGQPAGQDYIQLPIGFDANGNLKTEKGYIGSIYAPVWENAVLDIYPGIIKVRAKMKYERQVNSFLADVENSIKANSVVQGNAVKVESTQRGLLAEPIKVKENKWIVLADDTRRVIDNLIIPGLKESRKQSLLFTGDFGTGKTETALRVGAAGQRKFGRTFFYLKNSDMFAPLIPYLKNYAPCVVFVEDVDQISGGDRDSVMNNLLNQLDGNELKGIDCTFIFTTNSPDKIHPAMRRPGRIDQVVHFDYCTVESIAEIFRLHAEGMAGADTVDYMEAARATPEKLQGAVVAEIATRAVGYANHLYSGVISTDRFIDSVASMKYHIEFMRADQKVDHSLENLMGHAWYKMMKKAFPQIDTAETCGPNPFANSTYEGLQH